MIPKRMHRYFWEINPNELRLDEDADYITTRLLDYGKTQDINWLLQKFGQNRIRTVLKKYRDISRKTGLFWSALLNMQPGEVKCLQTPYHPESPDSRSWKNARDANGLAKAWGIG